MAERPADPAAGRPAAVKVVITGPYGAGKTTLIRTLSEINVLTTERRVSVPDHVADTKVETTVAMDFGRMTVDAGLQLYLFGTPGQKRFEFMWEILAEGMLGFVVLVDDSRPDSTEEARELLDHFATGHRVPHIVAVNKVPPGLEDQAARRARHQLRLGEDVRVVAGDVRDRDWAKSVLITLFEAARSHVATPARSGA